MKIRKIFSILGIEERYIFEELEISGGSTSHDIEKRKQNFKSTTIEHYRYFYEDDYKDTRRVVENIYSGPNNYYDLDLACIIYLIAKHQKDCTKNIEILFKQYYEKINNFLEDELDFEDVSEMENLIYSVRNDEFYRRLLFNVTVYKCIKKDVHRYGNYEKKKQLRFGNTNHYEELGIVDITIYKNGFELILRSEGSYFEDTNEISKIESTESKILNSLSYWKNYYYG